MSRQREADGVLVVGLNRSGTKWLSNMLSESPQIFSVRAPHHFGIIESNVFNDLSRVFRSLERPDDYAGFAAIWAETDLVKCADGTLDRLLAWEPRPQTPYQALGRLLREAAQRANCSRWLQKCTPPQAIQYLRSGDVRPQLVIIRRDPLAVLQSAVSLARQSGERGSMWGKCLVIAIQERLLRYLTRHPRAYVVTYDQLRANPQETLAGVCRFLEIPFDEGMLVSRYAPNTSFAQGPRIQVGFLPTCVLRLAQWTLALLPANWALRLWNRARSNRPLSMVRGSYRMLMGDDQNQEPSGDSAARPQISRP